MKEEFFGYNWDLRGKVVPALLSAWRVTRRLQGACIRIKYPVWVLDYAFADCGRFRVGTRVSGWQPRLARTAHLYPPGTIYWEDYRRMAQPMCRSAFVIFTGGEACGLDRLVLRRGRCARFADPHAVLGGLIEQAADIGQARGADGFWSAQAVLNQLVDALGRNEPGEDGVFSPRTAPAAAGVSPFVQEVNAFLEARLSESVNLAAAAERIGVSLSTLSHRYRRETGETPMARLTRLRINRARGLMLRGQPLKTVATATGFSDAFHLSKTFKSVEGLSPRAWLRLLSRGTPPAPGEGGTLSRSAPGILALRGRVDTLSALEAREARP